MADAAIQQLVKTCTRCGEIKLATLDIFPPHKMGRFGLHPQCRPCKKLYDAESRNRPDQRSRQKAWRDANPDYIKAYNQKYRDLGYTSTRHVAEWRANNLERARELDRRKVRRWRDEDMAYLLKTRLSSGLRRMIRNKSSASTEQILGYTSLQLMAHIERQFTKGMSWAALSRGEIEIDHIIPVSSFNITDVSDPQIRVCWGLANLRPLFKLANRTKGKKILTLL